jgi:rare lipoprotein A
MGYQWDCLQMRWKNSLVISGISAFALCSCGVFGGNNGEAFAQKRPAAVDVPLEQPLPAATVGDISQGTAQPTTADEKINYDEVGYASWYGDEVRGNRTASGDIFNPDGISAAHRSLPLPSFAEVTNLDTGRTILVRINDRGPFKKGRIIDLSAGAAQQLGVSDQGQFPVRVRRVNPPEFERRQLQNGAKATERLATPPSLLAALRRNLKPGEASPSVAAKPTKPRPPIVAAAPPPPVVATAGAQFDPPDAAMTKAPKSPPVITLPPPEVKTKMADVSTISSDYFVQIGAFSSQARADAFAKKAGASVVSAGNIWRVRVGPYENEEGARAALGPLAAKGYRDARVTR